MRCFSEDFGAAQVDICGLRLTVTLNLRSQAVLDRILRDGEFALTDLRRAW